MKIDFWYGNTKEDVAAADCFFSDTACIYRGHVYDETGKAIGDCATTDSLEVEKAFPGIFGK